jgi:protein-L-isoaspartate(D-aspartate) O-methyltransferase
LSGNAALRSQAAMPARLANLAFSGSLPHKVALAASAFQWGTTMVDFAQARRTMVDCQVRTSDVTDLRVIAALLDVARERFVPAQSRAVAYLDRDVPVHGSRVLIKPMVLGKLLQAAAISETDRVLDVGCATGYSSAVLGRLAARVVALEEDEGLAASAAEALAASGARNVAVANGPLVAGWPDEAPYDVILVQGASEVTPEPLLAQLKDGGRLLAVMGRAPTGAWPAGTPRRSPCSTPQPRCCRASSSRRPSSSSNCDRTR